MAELKQIPENATSFECQGKKYNIHKTLSFNRFEKLKEFSLEFGYSANIKDIMIGLRKAWDLINGSKFAETAVQLHNLMTGVVNLEQKEDVSLRIAALFINEESEDITVYDEQAIKDKISLWGKEYDVNFFFIFAISVVPSFLPVYKIVTQDFSLKNNLTEKIVNESNPQNISLSNSKEQRRYWSELIYDVCEGRPDDIISLKKFDVYDFFSFLENYKKKHDARN